MIPQSRIEQVKRDHGLCPDQDYLAHRIARDKAELIRRGRHRFTWPGFVQEVQ